MTSRRLMRSALQGSPILHVPLRVCNLNTSYNGNLSCYSRSATRSATERPMALVLLKFSTSWKRRLDHLDRRSARRALAIRTALRQSAKNSARRDRRL
jgi:hypothetical protein